MLNSIAGSGSGGAALVKLFRDRDTALALAMAIRSGGPIPDYGLGYAISFDSGFLDMGQQPGQGSLGAAHPFLGGIVLREEFFSVARGSEDWYKIAVTIGHEFQHLLKQGPIEVLSVQAEAEAYQSQVLLERDLSDTYRVGLYNRGNPSSFQTAALNVDLSDEASLRSFRDDYLDQRNPVYRNNPIKPSFPELVGNWISDRGPSASKRP